ncbi:hypothetical protein MN608_06174 [Microdochium nivale]|nr:hypothetical protein MN608_06174 [Microdochium nivale]
MKLSRHFFSMMGSAVALAFMLVVASAESTLYPNLYARDAYTCYGGYTGSVSDCEQVVLEVQKHGQVADAVDRYGGEEGGQQQEEQQEGLFSLYSGLCVVFQSGSCRARLCAVEHVPQPVNRTASWVVSTLGTPLLSSCIENGRLGVAGDSAAINGDSGTYRLWLG